jgi:hypothetical protein
VKKLEGLLRKIRGKLSQLIGIGREETLLYIRPSGAKLQDVAGDPGVSISVCSEIPIEQMAQFGWIKKVEVDRRIRRGDQCYVAHVDGRLAHYSWVQYSGYADIKSAGVVRPIPDGEFWIYDCCTAAWARGRKVYPAVLSRILRDYFEKGSNMAFIYTSRHNTSSQRGILRAGFNLHQVLGSIRIGRTYFANGSTEISKR